MDPTTDVAGHHDGRTEPAEGIGRVLRALSEYHALEQLGGIFLRLGREADARGNHDVALALTTIGEAAAEAQFERLELLDAIGLVPGSARDELVVEIGDRVFELPDLFAEVIRELLARGTANAPRLTMEDAMEQQQKQESGLFERAWDYAPTIGTYVLVFGLGVLTGRFVLNGHVDVTPAA